MSARLAKCLSVCICGCTAAENTSRHSVLLCSDKHATVLCDNRTQKVCRRLRGLCLHTTLYGCIAFVIIGSVVCRAFAGMYPGPSWLYLRV